MNKELTQTPLYYIAYNKEKFFKSTEILKNAINEIPEPTMHVSRACGFRMRAEFMFKIINFKPCFLMTTLSQNNKKTTHNVELFKLGHPNITHAIKLLKQYLPLYGNIIHKLFSVEFLTSTKNDIVVTFIYHKVLDKDWEQSANELQKVLNSVNNYDLSFNLIGRAHNQKFVLKDDFVTEDFIVNNKTYTMRHMDSSFSQPNWYMNEKMLNWAVNATKNFGDDLLELYCGNGNFSIPLSQNFNNVLATELSSTSVNAAQVNLKVNNIKNTKIIRLSAEEFTQAMQKTRDFKRLINTDTNLDDYKISTVLVDPPRAGLDLETLKLISQFENIIYISCGIDSLAENLKNLTKTHKLVQLDFFDQFPFTDHIETGCILKKI
ncbi:MAG: tRNA (uridine(54)-C5)-methyltransferase TrmA [Succinivibrionaceae bacterium]|nr:tRNA (uridine(54)-C5)-methyltransferase TrmA [Ruminobacter sp.]MDY5779318.1 tRNA (uridine(54)-C5)-methyltransferase TrmA [Succinivibrionaceae bacterium]MEE1339569.1 tRNA (uridine(54)-C5)-methyltransferase TrmA [Succinivibrionaceae bacterium]